MKRFLACILSVVLAIGLVPVPAFAVAELLQASALLVANDDGDAVVRAVDVTFDSKTQQGLYDAIVEQLDKQGLACETDDATLHVTMPATSNATFTTLDASHRNITSIKGLEQFTGLRWLDLSNNLVQTSTEFSGMKRLAHLDLYDNKVRDLSGFAGLTKLSYLNLGDNNERNRTTMSGLDALDTLAALEELDFSRNMTPEVTGHIKDLTGLTRLNLMQNGITDVFDLKNLTNMKALNLDSNSIAGVSSLAGMTNLEELLLANCKLYDTGKSSGNDKTGVDGLFNEQGIPLMTQLKKLDLMISSGAGFSKKGTKAHEHLQTLFQLFREKELELGFYYTWVEGLDTPDLQKTDGDVKYVTYDSFFPYCDGVHDDYYAMFNAHQYANKYGCEVRVTEGGTNAAADHAPFHIFKYYDTNDLVAYTDIDWQNANFVIHDEYIDDYPGRFKAIMFLYPAPVYQPSDGQAKTTSVSARKVTLSNGSGNNQFTINEGKVLNRETTSIKGLSDEVDAAIAKLGGGARLQALLRPGHQLELQAVPPLRLDEERGWQGSVGRFHRGRKRRYRAVELG